MSSIEYPTLPATAPQRVWALLWGAIWFVLINALICLMFGEDTSHTRFSYYTPYEEIRQVIGEIKQTPERTVVFVGGSVQWGAGLPEATQTLPAQFAQLLPDNVRVFNLGLIAGRPLDAYLLIHALRDEVDLFIMDYNYEFGKSIDPQRLLLEPGTYLRNQQLLTAYGQQLFADVPALKQCLATYKIPTVSHTTIGERTSQQWFERYLPVLRYKHRINAVLFGQHPLVFVERLLVDGGDVLRSTMPIGDLFQTEQDTVALEPWSPSDSAEEATFREQFQTQTFAETELLHCLTKAYMTYAGEQKLPVVTYLTPNNPVMFSALHGSPIHTQNVAILMGLFAGTSAYNLDTGALPGTAFSDSTHLTPAGSTQLAEVLFATLRDQLHTRGLLSDNAL